MTKDELAAINYYRVRIKDRRDYLNRAEKKLKRLTDKCDHEYSDKTTAINYGKCKICLEDGLYYHDIRYCEHCEQDTSHICRDSTHEGDDYQQCQICKWFMMGGDGEYIKGE